MLGNYPWRNADNPYRIIDGVALIVSTEEGKLLTLNEVGTFVWEQADGKRTLSDIISKVCDTFEAEPRQAAGDIQVFVRELAARKMLTLEEHASV